MKRNTRLGTLVVAALLSAGLAAAQVQTGSILVKVIDEQGAVVPGVTVTISSPALVTGQMVATTDAGGVYRFPSLAPGTYSVKLDLTGFQSMLRPNIVVSVGGTTPVDLTLTVAKMAETVTVSGEAPVIDTTSANVSVTLNEQLLQSTPGGRDIWSLVEYKVPSLIIEPAGRRRHAGRAAGRLQRPAGRPTPRTRSS